MKRVFLLLLACCLLIAPAAAAGGSGTAADPYIIQSVVELQSIQNNLAAYYKLANDINLQGVSFTPIGSTSSPFIGSFDGAGYTISNLVISSSTQSTGFFGCLGSGATIKDVTFQDCSVTSTSPWCGVVIGSIIMSSSAHETAVISNVDCVRCSVSTSSYTAGCLVGQCISASSTEITRCNVLYSQVHAGEAAGCFVGSCDGVSSLVIDSSRVQNSIAKITYDNIVSCLLAACSGGSSVNVLNCDVVNCLANGKNYVGGIVGICDGSGSVVTAQTCTVTGCTIVATNYAGGVAGRCLSGNTGIISGCTVTDSTIIASDYAAGVCPAYS